MATYYVKSGATGTADGSSWTNAFPTLVGAAAVDVAGDTIFVSHQHVEQPGTTMTLAFAGTDAAPVRVICVNDSAFPPEALSTTAVIGTAGAGNFIMSGNVYFYGIKVATAGTMALSNGIFNTCTFESTTASKTFTIGTASSSNYGITVFKECGVKLLTSSALQIYNGDVFFTGGSILSGTTSSLFVGVWGQSGRGCGNISMSGFDFSNAPAGFSICNVVNASTVFSITNSKLPASWTGGLTSAGTVPSAGAQINLANCDSTDTNYRIWRLSYAGDIKSETTIVRTGGASDGTTPLSWKFTSNGNSNYRGSVLASPEIVVWNDTTGSAKTITVEVLTDGVTLADDECWLEVQYLGTSGFPLGAFITDAKVDVLAAPANQTASTEAWTTTGLTTPIKQKLSVTFTPQEKGFVHAKVILAKPSTTVYVCPKASVT